MDIALKENGDGGDIEFTSGGDITADSGFGTAIYFSLFGGDSFSNSYNKEFQRTEDFENSLNETISINQMRLIENEANKAIEWLKSDKIVEEITTECTQVGVNKLKITITTTQPEEVATEYEYVWDQEKKGLIGN